MTLTHLCGISIRIIVLVTVLPAILISFLHTKTVQSFGEENVGEFTIAALVNLEYDWVNICELRLLCRIRQNFHPPEFSTVWY